MAVDAVVHITDVAAHHYTMNLGIYDEFGQEELEEWYTDQIERFGGMVSYGSGLLSSKLVARIWYVALDVH